MQKRNKVIYIGNQLTKSGYNPTTIDGLSIKLKGMGFNVVTASSKRNQIFRLLDMCWLIITHAKTSKVVLIDTYSTKAFYYAVICACLCRLLNLPYVPFLHGGNLPDRLAKNPRLSAFMFGKAFANISPSRYLEKSFADKGFKVTVIPNFIEIDKYPFTIKKMDLPRLLFVRSFHKIYNPLMALRVLMELNNQFSNPKLFMVGPDKDGSMIHFKENIEKMELMDQIVVTGRLSKEDWVKLALECNLFINTSNFDNMPVSIIEAMALGLPVISTNVGGISWVIDHGHNGFLCDRDNEKQMADLIRNLFDDEQLTEDIIQHGRKYAESLDWESSVKHLWVSFFQQLQITLH